MADPTKLVALTLQTGLDNATQGQLSDVLVALNMGLLLYGKEYDTGTVSSTATVVLPYEAAIVQSARVVASAGTAGSVGSYLVADSAATPFIPLGASTQCGVATIGVDRKTITFPNTVERAIIRYLPIGSGTPFGMGSTLLSAPKS
jgi:hypothetical protein